MRSPHETILEISNTHLINNFSYLKNKIPNTKIIAVVKAYAYGHGDIIIAKKLEKLGVDAFWVADFEEGGRLRKNKITKPIIVANPGLKSINEIIHNQLEVVIYNFTLLTLYSKLNKTINIHIKLNTGMNRYGFNQNELKKVIEILKKSPNLNVKSICSHLAASENASKDEFTLAQFNKFEKACDTFFNEIGYTVDRHILNTHGVLRFPHKKYEMVRLGIGLYGAVENKNLKEISVLKSIITQIRTIKKGGSIGYNASFIAKKEITVGVIPFGYADGLNRKLSAKNGCVLVNDTPCLIIGKISMDSCIIDLKGVKAKTGDKVIIFGGENTIFSISEKLETIPYEIYATLNRRIKRIYSL